MRLIVNTTAITPPLTGIGHYSTQLMRYLITQPVLEDIQGVSLSGTRLLSSDQLQSMIAQAEAGTDAGGAVTSTGRWRKLARQVPFARQVRRELSRYCLSPRRARLKGYRYWEPNFLRLPLDLPSAVTVYDLSHVAHPEFHPAERVRILAGGLEQSVRGAQKVIAISEFTRQEIIRAFSLAPDRVEIVPPAVSDHFRVTPKTNELVALRARYKLPEQYLLSVGTLEPRKNSVMLMRAFAALPANLRRSCPLVMVGGKGWHDKQIDVDLERLEARGELIRLGYVPQQDLPLLYRAARALAYISLYEGYGMPVAEAMVSGVPVVTSNCSSMPEVAADAAVLVNPEDIDDVKYGLERILLDQGLRQGCIASGLRQSSGYTWQASGKKLVSVLSELSD